VSTPARLALLEVIGRDGRVTRAVDVQRWPLTLGRSLEADVVLDDPFVAPLHATLQAADDGRLTLDVGNTDNGVQEGAQRHTRGSRVAVPVGGTTWQIGGLTVRLRTPDETLPGEQPLPVRARRAAWLPLAAAATLAVLALSNHWLSLDPGADTMDWIPLVAGLPLVLGLWAGLWATASKLFQHRFEFGAHLRLALPLVAAVEAVDWFGPPLAAALDLPWLWRLVTPLQVALLLALLYGHLALVLPQARRAVASFVGAAALAGAAVAITTTWQQVDRWSRAPYMSTLPTPWTLWRDPTPPETLAADLAPLAEQLARRVQKARDDEPPEAGDED
jgi:pSer/pThr/pTyr-binding forkhead associated (FHA) protein